MHNVHIQWAKATASEWVTVPLSEWATVAKKAADATLDEADGLIAHICVLGNILGEDRVSAEEMDDGKALVCGWSDNAMMDGSPIAKALVVGEEIVTSVREYSPRPGVRNREQMVGPFFTQTIYCAEAYWPKRPVYSNPGQVAFKPFSEFVPPADNVVRFGILIPDKLWAEHTAFSPPDDVKA